MQYKALKGEETSHKWMNVCTVAWPHVDSFSPTDCELFTFGRLASARGGSCTSAGFHINPMDVFFAFCTVGSRRAERPTHSLHESNVMHDETIALYCRFARISV